MNEKSNKVTAILKKISEDMVTFNEKMHDTMNRIIWNRIQYQKAIQVRVFKTIQVKNCSGCPFHQFKEHHTCRLQNSGNVISTVDNVPITPIWCPLKKHLYVKVEFVK